MHFLTSCASGVKSGRPGNVSETAGDTISSMGGSLIQRRSRWPFPHTAATTVFRAAQVAHWNPQVRVDLENFSQGFCSYYKAEQRRQASSGGRVSRNVEVQSSRRWATSLVPIRAKFTFGFVPEAAGADDWRFSFHHLLLVITQSSRIHRAFPLFTFSPP